MPVTSAPVRTPEVAVGYLQELGFPSTPILADLPVTVRMALSLKAEFESSYGDDEADRWELAAATLYDSIPERVTLGMQEYALRTRASTLDMLEEAEASVRRAAVRVPAGCFCAIMPSGSGCLTCTCPDCGAYSRFGLPVIHRGGCA